MEAFLKPIQFEWDDGNQQKTLKHGIDSAETEQTFFNFNLTIPDVSHSQIEPRFDMLGVTNQGKILFIVFTLRKNKVRVISSRRANHKERNIYEQALQEGAKI